ncbi:ubiquitin carboxyl-terminal hydrolase 43-like [Haemaphysalis longicornis]
MHSSDSSPPTRRRGAQHQHGNHPGSFFTIPRWMGGGGGGSKKQLQYRSLRSLEDPTPTSSATSTRRKRPSLFDQMVRRFFTPHIGHHHRGNSSSDSWNGKFSGPSRSGSLRDLRTRAVGGDPGGGDDTFFAGGGGGGKRSDSSSLSRTPAVAGIRNEGNTCFMNAVLQCLSNTDAFAEYLVSGAYRDDLAQSKNRAFSTSSSARVTEQLASVLSALWSCRTEGDFAARFKSCVEKHGSQYQGSEQHDAQEFLMWLLDKVHEELADDATSATSSSSSRTKRGSLKRSKSRSSSKGGGATPWQGSPVASLFAGQLKLRLTCPSCGRQSNNFDPFVCLSLPIPAASQWLCHVYFVPRNAPPTKLAFHVDFGAAMEQVRHKIATECHIPPDQLLLLEETKDGFGSLFEGDEVASAVSANSRLVALELPPASTDPAVPKDSQILVLCRSRVGSSGPCLGSTRAAWVSRELSVTELKKKLLEGIPTSRQSALKDQDLVNRLDVLVWDARQVLPADVDHPLFLEFVDCLLEASRDLAPAPLLRLMLQWEPQVADRLFLAEESIMDDTTTTTHQPEPEPSVSLSDCLAFYFTEEKLEPEEAWLCPQCDSRQQGFAQLGLWSCPEVLVIHLKRFHQNGGRHSKLATRVEVPLQDLDLSGHLCQGASVSGSALYDLYAFCSHHGTGLQGGHYTACCKNPVDEQWYLFDDARVRRALDEDLIARDAYLLFYRRQAPTTRVTRRSSSPGHWFTRTPLPTSRSHQQLLRGSPLRSTSIPVRGGSIPSSSPSGSTDNSLGTQSPASPLRELVPDLQIPKKSSPETGSEKPGFVESVPANRADGPMEKLNRLSPPPPTKTSPTKASPTRMMNRGSSFRPRPTYLSTAPARSSTATTTPTKSTTVATTALTRSTATMTTPPARSTAAVTKSGTVGDGLPRPSFLTCSPAVKPASFDITSAKLAAAVDTSATRTGRVALLAAKFSQPERPDNNVTTLSVKWQPDFLEGDSLDRMSLSRRPKGGGHSPMNGGENFFAPPACSELVYQSEPLNRVVSAPLSPDTLSRRVLSPRVSRSRQVRSQATDFDFERDVGVVESKASATVAEDVTTPPTLKEAFWTITSV